MGSSTGSHECSKIIIGEGSYKHKERSGRATSGYGACALFALTLTMQAGFTPLLIASQNGHIDVVKVLVEYGQEMDMNLQINNVVNLSC